MPMHRVSVHYGTGVCRLRINICSVMFATDVLRDICIIRFILFTWSFVTVFFSMLSQTDHIILLESMAVYLITCLPGLLKI